jgi:hypothetical protein
VATGTLTSELLHLDDFASDALAVREAVINGPFRAEKGPDGAVYTGISDYPVPHWQQRIAEARGQRIIPRLSCFRMNLEGEMPHSWVHSDDICAKYASVLYLNLPEQCQGGTAFWRHRILGIDRLPPKSEVGEDFYHCMDADWKILDLWEQIGVVAMKFNRFITYPTCLFHSRYPHEAFGKGPKDGRLIWICFYDVTR